MKFPTLSQPRGGAGKKTWRLMNNRTIVKKAKDSRGFTNKKLVKGVETKEGKVIFYPYRIKEFLKI